VDGPAITLDTVPDTSADKGTPLSVTAPDTDISLGEVTNVSFVVDGLDSDATAVIRVTDDATLVTSDTITANGTVTMDLSALADGQLSVSIRATDDAGNEAATSGPLLLLDTTGTGFPILLGTPEDDLIKDDNDNSEIFGFDGADKLIGNGGTDIIYGGLGNDTLRGDNGNDILNGGAGYDILRGGSDADIFVFDTDGLDGNTDLMNEFSVAEADMIDISGISAAFGWSAAEAASYIGYSTHDKGIYVELASPDVTQTLAELRDLNIGDVTISDFILV